MGKYAFGLAACALAAMAQPLAAQWTNRYPKVDGFGHQIYLEQENLPILSSGPVYPAPSPVGGSVAFSHQGWIWLLDVESGVATQVTNGAAMDARPRWSPDGSVLAFVRDHGADTSIVLRNLASGRETVIDTPAIELDPEFSRDGKSLFYTSARTGSLLIWKRDLATGSDTAFVDGKRLRRSARALADGSLVYHAMAYPSYALRVREADGETDRLLVEQGWMAHLDPDVHPSSRSMVYSVGVDDELRLAIIDIDKPEFPRWLTPPGGKALHAAFSGDGTQIYFVEADENEQFLLKRVAAAGGAAETVPIVRWNYLDELGTAMLRIGDETGKPIAARISLTREDGHPIPSPTGSSYVDSHTGAPYFYLDGASAVPLPQGRYRVVATRGPFSLPAEQVIEITAGRTSDIALRIDEIWDAAEAGYASADHHVHLNASGVQRLELEDLLLPMRGEALDTAAPMAWNLYNRFVDADKIGRSVTAADGTSALLSQEVRSDFHGHIGAIGLTRPFAPWFYGPRIPTYVTRDINNGQAVSFIQARGALPAYVHPVDGAEDPFADLEANPIPYELVLDGVLADGIGLELVCQWTSALGTAQAWYRFLNIGKPVVATSGTDMMANFYRAPAIGTARAYVPVTGRKNLFERVVDGVEAGTGFVTTGPALLFDVAGSAPGGTVRPGVRSFTIDLASVKAVDTVEIVVNGRVVQTLDGFAGGGSKRYTGTIDLPRGGWVAARAVGGELGWPSMTVFPFAHSSPIWIGKVGSTEPRAARAAARDLLKALDHSEAEFAEGYAEGIPAGLAHRIAMTRSELEALAR